MSMKFCPNCGIYTKPVERYCHNCGSELVFADKSHEEVVVRYKGYIQILGIVEIVLGIFDLVIGTIITLAAVFVTTLITSGEIEIDSNFAEASFIAGFIRIFLGFIVLLFVVTAVISIVSGIKLLQYKNSGRIGTMVIGAISLINAPVGTAFGAAALYILTRPEVEQLFS